MARNGSPWRWPLYPWVLFGFLGAGVCARSYYLCVSYHFVDKTPFERTNSIFGLYFLVPFRFKNALLLIFSLLFYAYGAGAIAIVLVLSILINYSGALLLVRAGRTKFLLFLALLAVNIGALVYYKYFGFLWDIANDVTLGSLSSSGLERPNVLLPIGISFFTFHGISYLTDVYRGDVELCQNPLDMALYMSFFPQLVAGPIVRAAYFLPQLARPSPEPIPIAPALLLIPCATAWSVSPVRS